MSGILEKVRESSREVAAISHRVRIDPERCSGFAASIPSDRLVHGEMDPAIHYLGHGRDTVAFFLILDSINFGSGLFPAVFRDPARSGFRAVAAALTAYFEERGPMQPSELVAADAARLLKVFKLDERNSAARRLTASYAGTLQELGRFICRRYDGDYGGVVEEAGGSAEKLVALMAQLESFRDVAVYGGMEVPFYKRAQLLAADLFIAFGGDGPGRFGDIDRLTICADNLVPHVLRYEGVLVYDRGLAERVDRGEPLPAGSPEEVEIRACAVSAGELIVEALRREGREITAMMLDNYLWHRGQEPFYRARPRHRTETIYY